jgi:hypothetical protein
MGAEGSQPAKENRRYVYKEEKMNDNRKYDVCI